MPWAPGGSSVHSRVSLGSPPARGPFPAQTRRHWGRPKELWRGKSSRYRSAQSLGPIGAGLTQVYSFPKVSPKGLPSPTLSWGQLPPAGAALNQGPLQAVHPCLLLWVWFQMACNCFVPVTRNRSFASGL